MWADDTIPDKLPYNIPFGAPITLERAQAAVQAAITEATKRGWPVNISVVDWAANPVLFARMDGAQLGSITVAEHKAGVAAKFRRPTMGFACAGRPEAQQIGPLFDPGVAGRERLNLSLGDHRHGGEIEAVQGLSRRQSGFLQMALEAPAVALHDLLLAERGQEAGGGPALLVGGRSQRRPGQFDARQSQLAEHQLDAGGVDLVARVHAASPALAIWS
jgi:hypothetical protein